MTKSIKLSIDKSGRPVVHVLKFDDTTNAMRASIVVLEEGHPKGLYCLVVNADGVPMVNSVDGEPVILNCPPLEMIMVDGDTRIMSRQEGAARAGVSTSTMKRAEEAGEIRKVKISERRVGYSAEDFRAWVARYKLKARA